VVPVNITKVVEQCGRNLGVDVTRMYLLQERYLRPPSPVVVVVGGWDGQARYLSNFSTSQVSMWLSPSESARATRRSSPTAQFHRGAEGL